ncbi:unnamed protein product [Microthlaspi erraticum]|uniref:Reverse transcriptase domain-containing protein n=1 Tax=Microthlaspi erraticum TaxID=1685480 RepID=A0A6D2L012_9BRAS|nr:unnamed protein product [Microthlaspi erraticum]
MENWHDLFPISHVQYLPMIGSDHRPILATLDSKIMRRWKQFRFDKRWIGLEGLLESIQRGWSTTRGEVDLSLVDRIQNCRHEISVWRKDKQPYGKQKIEELQRALEEVQNDDNSTQDELVDITNKLKEAYRDEEEYWKQKSRNMWLKDGDLNTKFFHASTKQRRAVNRIAGLHNDVNVWVAGEKEVEDVAVSYFDKLFTSSLLGDFTGVLEHMPHRITTQENEALVRHATESEVHDALFMMHSEKAPGPDSMTALFFQRSLHTIKNDVFKMVNNFLTAGTFDERLNMTHICLIPKTGRPSRMTELRPISLCNVGYKIISKVLCQKLKVLLPRGTETHSGLKVARACPPVSHLLFADDSLFFCKANVDKSQVLLQILKEYEITSGQQINLGKSSVQFGHTVEVGVRAEIHQILGISKVGGVGNYLGIPESIGGAKTKIFSFLIDRQQQRING